jgi:hypothetical protein
MDKYRPIVPWQLRSFFAFSSYLIGSSLYDSVALGLFAPQSMRYALAALTGIPDYLSMGFMACIFALLPFFVLQVRPLAPPRWAVVLACVGCFAGAVLWIGAAFAARDAELNIVRTLYVRQAIEAAIFMVLIAAHRNHEIKVAYGMDRERARDHGSNYAPLDGLPHVDF